MNKVNTQVHLGVTEICKLLKISTAKIYDACYNGHLKYIKVGNQYKFTMDDVVIWIEKYKDEGLIDVNAIVDKYLERHIMIR